MVVIIKVTVMSFTENFQIDGLLHYWKIIKFIFFTFQVYKIYTLQIYILNPM